MKIIEWIKGFWNKKYDNSKKQISDEELKQKKEQFQIRKQTIDEYLDTLLRLSDNRLNFNDNMEYVLDIIHTAIIKLHNFDKYDLTNPYVTYEEQYNVIITDCRTSIMNILDDVADIPIEILVYYATRRSYLRELLNEQNDLKYQSYCGMFKNDVVILLVDLGFKSLFD